MTEVGATVLGSDGFIGRELVLKLTSSGVNVLSINRNNFDEQLHSVQLGHVFYCSGKSKNFLNDYLDTVDAHVNKLCRILELGNFESLTYLSSSRLYDYSESKCLNSVDSSFKVNPHLPRNLFDLSKLLGESICLNSGLPQVRVARISNVYRNRHDTNGFIGEALRWFSQFPDLPMKITSCKNESRDYIHMEDLVAYLINVGFHGKQRIYNIGSGTNTTNADLEKIAFNAKRFVFKYDHSDCFGEANLLDVSETQAEFGLPKIEFKVEFGRLIRELGVS
jgi:nucleoside-diphosphate-sugar epimerase